MCWQLDISASASPGRSMLYCRFLSTIPSAWSQSIIFSAAPGFLCFPSTFLLRNSLLPVTPLLPYDGLYLQSCLACDPITSNIALQVQNQIQAYVFIRCLCHYILTLGPMEISVLWETWQRGGTEWESAVWKWPCLSWQPIWAPGLKQRGGRAKQVNTEAPLQLRLCSWLGSRAGKVSDQGESICLQGILHLDTKTSMMLGWVPSYYCFFSFMCVINVCMGNFFTRDFLALMSHGVKTCTTTATCSCKVIRKILPAMLQDSWGKEVTGSNTHAVSLAFWPPRHLPQLCSCFSFPEKSIFTSFSLGWATAADFHIAAQLTNSPILFFLPCASVQRIVRPDVLPWLALSPDSPGNVPSAVSQRDRTKINKAMKKTKTAS